MPKSDTKTQVKVTINIRPGPVSPAQREAWRRAWTTLLSAARKQQAQDEAKK